MITDRLARVLTLSPSDRRLLFEALVLLGMVAPVLKYGPGAVAGRLLKRAAAGSSGTADREVVLDVVRAVTRASPHVPGATCLAQALAGWVMVRRRHAGAVVRLGVNRSATSELLAHAWLECNGERVIGGQSGADFTPFPPVS